MEKREIVIFGAGGGGWKVYRILKSIGCEIRAFVDNNEKKWGSDITGIPIVAPKQIQDTDDIMIASVYQKEIIKQLKQMHRESQIVLKERYIQAYFEKHLPEIKEEIASAAKQNGETTYILESEIGLGHWGVEQYVRTVAKILLSKEEMVQILTNKGKYDFNAELEPYITYLDFAAGDYVENVKAVAKKIISNLPCVVMDNWQNTTLTAALLVKQIYPDKIKIVSMIHNDLYKLREIVNYYQDELDVIGAVSEDVLNKLKKEFHLPDNYPLFYKESPVMGNDNERSYQVDSAEPIRIAYGARIIKEQKRTHLLVKIIDLLEKEKLNYILDIAGDGPYKNELANEIANRNLAGKVNLLGSIPSNQMRNFWSQHDIFINLSLFEGVGLSMLEAMAEGCVPIVTRVAGTTEFIVDGENGFYTESDEWCKIVDKILYLEIHRNELEVMGKRAKEIIDQKCSIDGFYVKFKEIMTGTEKRNEKISVIMPVYNAEKYLEEAVRSILNQTYTNFELIVINDGSTDRSLEILENLQKEDERIRVVSRENRGLVETLNEGIEIAKTKYIARMDADDISHPERFTKEMERFQNDEELYLVGSNFENIYEENVSPEIRKLKERFEKNVNEPVSGDNWRGDIFEDYKILHPTWIVKKELFDKIGKYKQYMAEDVEFLFRTVCEGYKVGKVEEKLLTYRIGNDAKSAIEGIQQKNKEEICCFKFDYINKQLNNRMEHLKYLIWGADLSGQIFFDMMQNRYPNSKCVAYIDSFQEGEFQGEKVILPEQIQKMDYHYIFICTNGGRKAAKECMNQLGKKEIEDYFKVV